MYCRKCDALLDENAKVCARCGKKVKNPEENDSKKLIIIIVIISLITAIGIFVGCIIVSNDKKELTNNKKVEVTTIQNEGYVTFANYTFALPENLQYSNEDNYIYCANSDSSIYFKLNLIPASYKQVKEDSEDFVKTLLSSGNKIISYNVLNQDNTEYFVIALTQNNSRYLYALTQLDNNYSVQILLHSSSNDGYETGLGYVNKIIESSEKLEADLNLTATGTFEDFLIFNSNIDIEDLFEVQNEE